MFTNADQLTSSKISELKERIQLEKPLVVAVCEIKSKNANILSSQDYTIPGYSLHPVNIDAHGRGIAIYTHSSLDKSVIQIKPELKYEEACLLEIRLRGGDLLLFGCFYRSPTPTNTSSQNNDDLNKLFRFISRKNYSHKCLLGDFNYRDINWMTLTTSHNEDSKEAKFIETVQDCFLHQHMQLPTRRRGNDVPSLLDLLFTDEAMQVSSIAHHAPLGKSDHSVITFQFNCYLDYSNPKETYRFDKADYDTMRAYLVEKRWENDFIESGSDMSVDDMWEKIKSMFSELRNRFVTKHKISGKPTWRDKGSFPVQKPLQEAIRNKRIQHRHWMTARNHCDANTKRMSYTNARNKVKTMIRQAKRKFEKNIAGMSKQNPKAFWSHIRSKLKTRTGVAPLLENIKDKNSTKFHDEDKANILQNQFSSVFTKEPEGEIPSLGKRTDAFIANLTITEELVRSEIMKLNVNKSFGPDEIHPRMLIELVDSVSKPIAFLMNKTMEQGQLPRDWKRANVCPIYKKGARNHAENYRPISLTSVICKLMEKFVKDSVMRHIISNGMLSPKQYGFISGRSTTTQLLRYLDECVENVVKGEVVDTIYLDYAKAFDTVPHRRLISKLDSYGIKGNIQNWIKDFLSERSQVVKVNGKASKPAPVISGIPQGSVLGPILFVIYINDLPDEVNSSVFLFADDTKIFNQIKSFGDACMLQQDLDSLECWSQKWLLRFNTDKCHVLTLGKFENIMHTHRYKIYGKELQHVFEEKDLGVIIDSDLKFEEHMAQKIKTANIVMGLIRRSFSFLDYKLFKKLYTTFVRPHLEYAQAVWAPHLKKHVKMLENVQKRATKLVDNLNDLEYSERLRKLDLPTLAYRRARGDMIELFKHFHSYDRPSLSNSFLPSTRPSRKHKYQLISKIPKDGTRGIQTNSFYYRTTSTWNDLPKEVVNAKNINEFKNKLDEAWQKIPMKFHDLPTSDE